MPLPDAVARIIDAARRRLLLAATIEKVVVAIAVASFIAAGAIGVARNTPAPWVEPTAVVVLAVAVVIGLLLAVLSRPSARRSAIEIDARMHGFDRVSTALELSARTGLNDAERRQIEAAGKWAQNRQLSGFDGLLPKGPVLPLLALGVGAALLLALVPSPADAVVEQRRADTALDSSPDRDARRTGGHGNPGGAG